MSDSWITAADASTVTGETIADADVAKAMPIIEIFSGVTTDATPDLRSKDLRMLRYATAYQAAWMKPNASVLTGSDIQSASQDSVSFTRFTEGHADAGVLAPLASRCLQRLSWRRSKTVQSYSAWDYLERRRYAGDEGPFEDEPEDEYGEWRPLGRP